MNAQHTQLKEEIQQRIVHLQNECNRLKSYLDPIEPCCSLGDLGRNELLIQQEIEAKQYNKLQTEITHLKEALRTIENPNFGLCISCDEPIEFERLQLIPYAKECITCVKLSS